MTRDRARQCARVTLLGFGADVEALDPGELCGELAATAAALTALYGSSGALPGA